MSPYQSQTSDNIETRHRISTGRKNTFRHHFARYARWDRELAGPGEMVEMQVSLPGLPGQKEGKISIYERDADGNDDLIESDISIKLNYGVGAAEWQVRYVDDSDDIPETQFVGELKDELEEVSEPEDSPWNPPEFYFKVECEGKKGLSTILRYQDNLELEILDEEDEPITVAHCTILFVDGTERKGIIRNGFLKIEDVPPLSYILNIEGYSDQELE